MSVSLSVTASPERLPLDRICDVELGLTLTNTGTKSVEIVPKAAKLAAIASFAGIGITWSFELLPEGGGASLPVIELRRWYGPPGNPPSPAYAKKDSVTIKPGAQHVEPMVACWIPNDRLAPEHLSPATIDPEGMDNIGPRAWTPPAGTSIPAPLHESFPLAQASVLVLQVNASFIKPAMKKLPDFLRGHVVAFVPGAGTYQMQVGYSQNSWMGVGETLLVRAAPVPLRVGA